MSQCTTTQDVLVKLEQAVERGDVPYLHALLINQNLGRCPGPRSGRPRARVTSIFIPAPCNGSACLRFRAAARRRLFAFAVPPCP